MSEFSNENSAIQEKEENLNIKNEICDLLKQKKKKSFNWKRKCKSIRYKNKKRTFNTSINKRL